MPMPTRSSDWSISSACCLVIPTVRVLKLQIFLVGLNCLLTSESPACCQRQNPKSALSRSVRGPAQPCEPRESIPVQRPIHNNASGRVNFLRPNGSRYSQEDIASEAAAEMRLPV